MKASAKINDSSLFLLAAFLLFSREKTVSLFFFFLLLKERKKTITRGSFSWGKVRFKEELQPAENKDPNGLQFKSFVLVFFVCATSMYHFF